MSQPSDDQGQARPSGLRNPEASVRGVAAAALATEGLMLLLTLVPLRVLGAGSAGNLAFVATLAVISFALAGMARRRWVWWVGSLVPVAVIAAGFFVHPAIGVVGVIFGLVWLYVLSVRKKVLGR